MFRKSQDHLDSVHESYFQHLFFAASVGGRMIGAGLAVILHGLCPAVFQYTGSRTILNLADHLKARLSAAGAHGHSTSERSDDR